MVYNKLHGRGYSGKVLTKYFLKFCSRYPVDLKYNIPDGNSLWTKVQKHEKSKSCCIYDYEAIDEIVKSCNVVLDDIYPYTKSISEVKNPINGPEQTDSPVQARNDQSSSTSTETIGIFPQSLDNPSNHCYINSTLQVIYRIFMHFNEGIHFNNNREGCLIKCLIDGIYSNSNESLSYFKMQLSRFDGFFSGVYQQDAYECFCLFMDIMHIGTRQNLLGDEFLNNSGDDQFVNSLTKRLFMFTIKHSTQCVNCRLMTSSYSESRSHFLFPSEDTSIKIMFESSRKSNFRKQCGCCNSNTNHEELINFEQPPEILVLIINRFDTNLASKNKNKILIDNKLNISSVCYDLIGSIHHHGRSIASGHYTSNIWYTESAFLCNDKHIGPLNDFPPSATAYMVFYSRNT